MVRIVEQEVARQAAYLTLLKTRVSLAAIYTHQAKEKFVVYMNFI